MSRRSRACRTISTRRVGAAALRRRHHLQRLAPQRRRPGDLVAVHGVGGLGHLGMQFAARQGFRTVAVNRGRDKEELARSLGASDYIDSAAEDPAKALPRWAARRRSSPPSPTAGDAGDRRRPRPERRHDGDRRGRAADGQFVRSARQARAVKGWYSGVARDSEDTLSFSQRNKVASMNEIYPFEKAQEAYDRMMSGKARFRVVLKMDA
jgi:alcohol dehydrogenase